MSITIKRDAIRDGAPKPGDVEIPDAPSKTVVYTFVDHGTTPGPNEIALPGTLALTETGAKITRVGDLVVAEGRFAVVGTPSEIHLPLPADVAAEDDGSGWVLIYSGLTTGPVFAMIFDDGNGGQVLNFSLAEGAGFDNEWLILLGGIVYTAA